MRVKELSKNIRLLVYGLRLPATLYYMVLSLLLNKRFSVRDTYALRLRFVLLQI